MIKLKDLKLCHHINPHNKENIKTCETFTLLQQISNSIHFLNIVVSDIFKEKPIFAKICTYKNFKSLTNMRWRCKILERIYHGPQKELVVQLWPPIAHKNSTTLLLVMVANMENALMHILKSPGPDSIHHYHNCVCSHWHVQAAHSMEMNKTFLYDEKNKMNFHYLGLHIHLPTYICTCQQMYSSGPLSL